MLDASLAGDAADRPTIVDLAGRLEAHTTPPPGQRSACQPQLGTSTRAIGSDVSREPATPTSRTAQGRRRAARAAVSVMVTLVASIMLITPATGPRPMPPPPSRPSHPAHSPPETSHPVALHSRQADAGRPRPRRTHRPTTSGLPNFAEPSWLQNAIQSWSAMEPYRHRRSVRTSCAHVRSRRCFRPEIYSLSASDRSPRWPISWMPPGYSIRGP
jgi:hypothetical protein